MGWGIRGADGGISGIFCMISGELTNLTWILSSLDGSPKHTPQAMDLVATPCSTENGDFLMIIKAHNTNR